MGKIFAYVLLWEKGQVAAPIYRGSRAKFFSWTTCKHDFGPYPSDRELFYDIAFFVVRLLPKASTSLGTYNRWTAAELLWASPC